MITISAHQAGVAAKFVSESITALTSAGIAPGFRFIMDFGTVHGLTPVLPPLPHMLVMNTAATIKSCVHSVPSAFLKTRILRERKLQRDRVMAVLLSRHYGITVMIRLSEKESACSR